VAVPNVYEAGGGGRGGSAGRRRGETEAVAEGEDEEEGVGQKSGVVSGLTANPFLDSSELFEFVCSSLDATEAMASMPEEEDEEEIVEPGVTGKSNTDAADVL